VGEFVHFGDTADLSLTDGGGAALELTRDNDRPAEETVDPA
jgi:hypothetical protein